MRLEPRVLDEAATAGARLVLQRLVAAALEQLGALEQGSGPEALHDFRVALRRFRSLERSFRESVPGLVRGRHRRALRDIAQTTNGARDAEVQLAWLSAKRGAFPRRDRPALEWLTSRLEGQQRTGYALATDKLARRFRKVAAELERDLARGGDPSRGAPFAALVAELLRDGLGELLGALDAVSAPLDVDRIHSARIAAKRLRYLLEPLRGNERADAEPVVAILKELQDLLGELHDAHVLGETLGAALVEVASERARRLHAAAQARTEPARAGRRSRDDLTPGLLDLDVRATERVTAAYAALARNWLPARRGALAGAVTAVVDALSPPAAGRPGASRRFLLLRVPDGLPAAPELELEQGWLPGDPPRQWLLRISGHGGSAHLRGGGSALAQERIPEDRFAAMWPDTEGLRLARRRHLFVRDGRSWSIDVVGEHGPVLAEIAGSPGLALHVPRRIREVLVREVTDERAYSDEELAARRRRDRPSPLEARAGDLRAV